MALRIMSKKSEQEGKSIAKRVWKLPTAPRTTSNKGGVAHTSETFGGQLPHNNKVDTNQNNNQESNKYIKSQASIKLTSDTVEAPAGFVSSATLKVHRTHSGRQQDQYRGTFEDDGSLVDIEESEKIKRKHH